MRKGGVSVKILVLDKNKVTGEDKSKETWKEVCCKLNEELIEVVGAVAIGNKEHMAEELFDIIQVAVGGLDKLGTDDKVDLEQEDIKHNNKLIGRGWSRKKIYEVEEIE